MNENKTKIGFITEASVVANDDLDSFVGSLVEGGHEILAIKDAKDYFPDANEEDKVLFVVRFMYEEDQDKVK